MYAAENGYTKVVEILLKHGASVDLKTEVSAPQLQPRFTFIKLLMCK